MHIEHSVFFYLHLLISSTSSLIAWLFYHSIDKWNKFVQLIALIVGGVAAYYRWFNGRVWKKRLEPTLSVSLFDKDETAYMTVTFSVKNVGLSKVDLDASCSSLVIKSGESLPNTQHCLSVEWKSIGSFRIFDAGPFIESGESIQEQKMVALPLDDAVAYHLEAHIYSGKSCWPLKMLVIPEEKNTRPQKRRRMIE